MVSHDAVAFYLLSQEVSRAHQGRAVRAGRRRGLRRVPLVPAAATACASRTPGRLRQGVLRPRPRRHGAGRVARGLRCHERPRPGGPSYAFVRDHFAGPGATPRSTRAAPGHRGHARRRPRQAGRQHDDGVGPGGPGAVPRPRAGRARGPVPAGAQARRGRQGRPQGRRAQRHAARGHRPAQGVLPRAGHHAPAGQGARRRPRRPARPGGQERGLFADDYVQQLVRRPERRRSRRCAATSCGSSGLLERWLQTHEVG